MVGESGTQRRWYVRMGSETIGPVDESTILQMAPTGTLDRAEVSPESPHEWTPIAASPFSSLLPKAREQRPTLFSGLAWLLNALPTVSSVLAGVGGIALTWGWPKEEGGRYVAGATAALGYLAGWFVVKWARRR